MAQWDLGRFYTVPHTIVCRSRDLTWSSWVLDVVWLSLLHELLPCTRGALGRNVTVLVLSGACLSRSSRSTRLNCSANSGVIEAVESASWEDFISSLNCSILISRNLRNVTRFLDGGGRVKSRIVNKALWSDGWPGRTLDSQIGWSVFLEIRSSKVWPPLWVGSWICWQRSAESKMSMNALASLLELSSTWTLKSPVMIKWLLVIIVSSSKVGKSRKNIVDVSLFSEDGGGRYTAKSLDNDDPYWKIHMFEWLELSRLIHRNLQSTAIDNTHSSTMSFAR